MQTFTYDAIGNPLTYKNGWQLSWQNGRQLATVEQENGSVSYTYDENGIRQTKTMGEKVVTFRTEGSQILSQDQIPLHLQLGDANGDGILDTSDLALLRKALAGVPIGENQKERLDLNRDGTLTTDDLTQFKRIQAGLSEAPNEWLDQSGVLGFLYGASGEPLGFTIGDPDVFGGTTYWYITNLQGDVIGLLDEDGNRIANYAYDAWGSLLSLTDASGNTITDTTHPANLNPLRYRGYYYDSETGFYYLNSRYYDPEVGRFINADSLIDNRGIITQNLFQYCGNNPVNNADPSGNLFGTIVGIGLLVIGIVATLSGCSSKPAATTSTPSTPSKPSTPSSSTSSTTPPHIPSPQEKSYAATVYAEAGGQNKRSKQAVAHVMNNRIGTRSSWTDIESVISAKYQFDGYNSPMYQAAMNYYNNGICNNSIEQAAMDECLAVVIPIYSGAEADITGGALYFHSFPNPSDWAYHNSYTQVCVSGTEKFWFYK